MYQKPKSTSSQSTQPTTTLVTRRHNPDLAKKISQMALPLAPLVRITTGEVHPSFPATLLNFWVLTSEQLDELAHFYHQRTPSVWSAHYPCPVVWETGLTLEEKRRKIGRFIGLRGCETPTRSDEELLRAARERARRDEDDEALWRRKGRFY